MQHFGEITHVTRNRGFGFIRSAEYPDGLFFHAHALEGLDFDDQLKFRRVTFTVGTDRDGRTRAEAVRPA